MNQKEQTFIDRMAPYAKRAAAKTNIPETTILSQWAWETGWGTSQLAKTANNYAGIKYTSRADFRSGVYSGYKSIDSFVQDYVTTMKHSDYNKVRSAGSAIASDKALGASPWAGDPAYGKHLVTVTNMIMGHVPSVSGNAHKPHNWWDALTNDVTKMPKEELFKYAAVGLGAAMLVKNL